MKSMLVLLLVVQCAFSFAELPAGIDESRLAGLFPISVLGIHNQDGTIPGSVYHEIENCFLNGISRLKRFKAKKYMDCTLSAFEIPVFISYMKERRRLEQLLYEEETGTTEEQAEEKDICKQAKEMSLEEIREEFGEDVAALVEKTRNKRESDVDEDEGADIPVSEETCHYDFENLPEDIIDRIMERQYLLVATVSDYEKGSELEKEEQEESQEDEEGNSKRIIRTTITLRAHAGFHISIMIIDTKTCEIVMKDFAQMTGENTISRDDTREAKEEKKDDSGNILGKVLKKILDFDDETDDVDSVEKDIRRELKSKRKDCEGDAGFDAAKKVNDYMYTLLSSADVFHIDTIILKVEGRHVYLNKGSRWDVGEGDEFLLNPGKKNEVFIRVEKTEKMYSIAKVLWGRPRENAVLADRGRSHINMEIRAGVYNYIGLADYGRTALALAADNPVPDEKEFQVWPYFSLWIDVELGYRFIIALDFGGAFSPYESGTYVIDGATGAGCRFFMGKLTFESYIMAGAMLFVNERQYTWSSATAAGLEPPGTEDIILSMGTIGCYVKPVIGISCFLIPEITVSLKADYRYTFIDALFYTTEREVSASESYNTRNVGENSYFSLDGCTITLSIMFRF